MPPGLFLSTLPARGATVRCVVYDASCLISIHAPREGSDFKILRISFITSYFYPRSPRGERPVGPAWLPLVAAFLSTLPARGATSPGYGLESLRSDFYPRSPRGERLGPAACSSCLALFLSTLPARGATFFALSMALNCRNFYPRSPRGERRRRQHPAVRGAGISIHAPREGSDSRYEGNPKAGKVFLSTLPARGATGGIAGPVKLSLFLSTLPARGATL